MDYIHNLSDTSFINSFKDGDMQSFETIYNETKDFVYRIIYKMVQNQPEAEDLMQDTFIRLYEKRQKFTHRSSLKTWIYRIAVNHTINHLNKKKRLSINIYKLEIRTTTDTAEEANEDIKIIHKLLDKINPSYKICSLLKENEKMKYDDIAKTLGINIGTVRSRINRAKKQLVKLYKKEVSSHE